MILRRLPQFKDNFILNFYSGNFDDIMNFFYLFRIIFNIISSIMLLGRMIYLLQKEDVHIFVSVGISKILSFKKFFLVIILAKRDDGGITKNVN